MFLKRLNKIVHIKLQVQDLVQSENTQRGGWRDGSVVKALTAFQKTWIQFPAPTGWLTRPAITPVPGATVLFWSPSAPDTQVVHRHKCRQNTNTCKNQKLKKNLTVHFSF